MKMYAYKIQESKYKKEIRIFFYEAENMKRQNYWTHNLKL